MQFLYIYDQFSTRYEGMYHIGEIMPPYGTLVMSNIDILAYRYSDSTMIRSIQLTLRKPDF